MSTEPQQTPTKEQLKKLAGAPTLHLRTPESQNNQSNSNTHQNLLEPGELNLDNLRSVRPISARAIPKALFTALLLSPVFLVAFVFVNGIKLPSKNNAQTEISKAQRAESAINSDASDETTQLRKQLAEANAQLALIQQQDNKQVEKPKPKVADSKAKPVVQKRATPTRAITRTATPVPQVQQPVRRIAVSTPPQPIYPSTKIPKSVAPKPTKIAQSNEYRPQTASVKSNKPIPAPTVKVDPLERWQQLAQLGSHGGISAEVPQESIVAENFSETPDNFSYQPAIYQISSKPAQPEKSLTQETQQSPAIEPELEAPILQGQPRRFISAGTTTKALLVTPFVWDESENTQTNQLNVVLAEPLLAADGTIALPAKTQLLVEARSLSKNGLLRLVAVAAIVKQDQQQYEIALPFDAIGIYGEEGKPLIVQKLSDKRREVSRRNITRLAIGAIAQASSGSHSGGFSRSRQNDDSNLLTGILEGGSEAILSDIDKRNSDAISAIEKRPDVLFLKAGTKVEVFVNSAAAIDVFGSNQPILESQQTQTEQIALVSDNNIFPSASEVPLPNLIPEPEITEEIQNLAWADEQQFNSGLTVQRVSETAQSVAPDNFAD